MRPYATAKPVIAPANAATAKGGNKSRITHATSNPMAPFQTTLTS